MKKVMIIAMLCLTLIGVKVKATTITTTEDIEEIGDIVELAINYDKDIFVKNYIILKNNDKIQLIIFKEYEQQNNTITIEQASIITKESGVNTIEQNEENLIININNVIYTNIKMNKGKINKEIEEYKFKQNITWVVVIGVGIIFSLLLLKE